MSRPTMGHERGREPTRPTSGGRGGPRAAGPQNLPRKSRKNFRPAHFIQWFFFRAKRSEATNFGRRPPPRPLFDQNLLSLPSIAQFRSHTHTLSLSPWMPERERASERERERER